MAKNKKILLILLLVAVIILLIFLPGILNDRETAETEVIATAAVTEIPTDAPTEIPTAPPTQAPTQAPTAVPATPPPETEPPIVEITAEPVLVSTTEYELTYSGSLAEFISYQENPETPLTDLAFQIRLGENDQKIFTLVLNSEEGDIVSMVEAASGEQIPVAFIMDELPPNLNPEEEELFFQAQEIVNEVISSIVLK